MITSVLLSVALTVGLPAPTQVASSAPEAPVPIYGDSTLLLDALEGVWRLPGYGLLVEFGAQRPRLFSETDYACWETDLEDLFDLELLHADFSAERAAWQIYTDPEEAPYVLERRESLPAGCLAEREWTHLELFEAFAAVFDDHYPFFEARGFDWEARKQAARAALAGPSTEPELFAAMASCLEGLGDGHVGLEAEIGGEEFELDALEPRVGQRVQEQLRAEHGAGYDPALEGPAFEEVGRGIREGVLERLLGGEAKVAIDSFPWGRLEGDVGYILITGMGVDDEMPLAEQVSLIHGAFDEMLAGLEGITSLILDVSLNGGGFDVASLAMAGHFVERGGVVYTKEPNGHPELRREIAVERWEGRRFTGPTFVVSSDQTASAAEIFQLAMGAQPHVKLIGALGESCFSDVIPRRLPNGWMLYMGPEVYRDIDGVCHEGRGVPLDLEHPIFEGPDPATSHAEALEGIAALAREAAATGPVEAGADR